MVGREYRTATRSSPLCKLGGRSRCRTLAVERVRERVRVEVPSDDDFARVLGINHRPVIDGPSDGSVVLAIVARTEITLTEGDASGHGVGVVLQDLHVMAIPRD